MSQLYSEAAAVLAPSLRRKSGAHASSLKSRTYSPNITNKKLTHLLVSETLKHREAIDCILQRCNVDLLSLSKNEALVYIYLFELLFGRSKRVLGGGALKKQIMELGPRLEQAKQVVMKQFPHLARVERTAIPRYCRVNTLKTSMDKVQAIFPQATVDEHLSEFLLHLPANTADLHEHPSVLGGEIILQDKSSCFPVAALEIEMRARGLLEFDAIDCCAAPGNKTTQLCAAMRGGKGKVFAFDKSKPRHALLEQRMKQAGGNALCLCEDFLQQTASDARFARTRTILLDPSCSGSGSYSVERLSEAKLREEDERVQRLAQFQLEILAHALSFPQVQLVSYSTCSILFPENELVCQQALERFGEEWELVHALPQWPRRGVCKPNGLCEADAQRVVRADFLQGDATGGFFLALFARKLTGKVGAAAPSSSPPPAQEEEEVIVQPARRREIIVRDLVSKRIVKRLRV